MHVALVVDRVWLADEQAMYRFLVVGLMDEQVQVMQVVPQGLTQGAAGTFGRQVTWRPTGLAWLMRRRIEALGDSLEPLVVTVLHALDGRLWAGALRLAGRLGVPVVLASNRESDLAQAVGLRRQIAANRTAFSAATAPLQQALRQRVSDPSMVYLVPPGAHIPAEKGIPSAGDVLCMVITGNGVFDVQYQALYEALVEFVEAHPQTLLFFDTQGGDPHPLWQAARRYNLLNYSSMIPSHLSHRKLLMGAHVLIQPQANGQARCLTIQAMACGVPVLAKEDPWIDYLIDGQTAWMTKQGGMSSWAGLIRRWQREPAAVAALTDTARQWVRERHLASAQVEQTLDMYHKLAGQTYKFPADGQ